MGRHADVLSTIVLGGVLVMNSIDSYLEERRRHVSVFAKASSILTSLSCIDFVVSLYGKVNRSFRIP